jgi:NTE family protein
MNINTLVFSGGGFKGLCFIGVMKLLSKKRILKNINTFIGSSIGCLIIFIYLCDFDIDEIEHLIIILSNINQFQKINIESFLNFKKLYGLENGNKFVQLMKKIMIVKNISPYITFKQLYEKNKKHFIMTGTNIDKTSVESFDYINTPDMPIILGLRITISIPIIYTPIKYKGMYYIDGAVLNNFPIDLSKDKKHTLGVSVASSDLVENTNLLDKLTKCYFKLQEKHDCINSIYILNLFDHKMPTYTDKLSQVDIKQCINNGYESMLKFYEFHTKKEEEKL